MKSRFNRISRLDVPLRVAVEMYDMEHHGERVWFARVVQRLTSIVEYYDLLDAFDILRDFGILSGEYGTTEHGYAVYLYSLTEYGNASVGKIYDVIVSNNVDTTISPINEVQ